MAAFDERGVALGPPHRALGVVLAAHGYPMHPRKGDVITGCPRFSDTDTNLDHAVVFHAGTALNDGQLTVTGGRVLCVTALAESVKAAQQKVYAVAQGIHFDGMQYRKDIGYRAVKS
jgi:phosphoribosylamine---glycine ligase